MKSSRPVRARPQAAALSDQMATQTIRTLRRFSRSVSRPMNSPASEKVRTKAAPSISPISPSLRCSDAFTGPTSSVRIERSR